MLRHVHELGALLKAQCQCQNSGDAKLGKNMEEHQQELSPPLNSPDEDEHSSGQCRTDEH